MTESPLSGRPPGLTRGLALLPTTAIIVTAVIGSGVFIKARVMTCNVGSPGLVLLAYAAAGVFTLAGALSYAELGAMMPRAGGSYNYVGAAFGRFWAFMNGWGISVRGIGGNAALAVAFGIFFNDLLGGTLTSVQAKMVSGGAILLLTLLAIAPVRDNGMIASVVTTLKVVLVAGIGIAAFAFGDGSWAHFGASGAGGVCEGVPDSARLGAAGFGAAIVGALWSYSGWTYVALLAEEVRRPGRTIPRALFAATLILVSLYLLVNAGYFYVLDPVTVAGIPATESVASHVLVRLIGAAGATILAVGMLVSTIGALHAGLLARSRMYFAIARDGLYPHALARVSSRTHVPTTAVLVLGALAFLAAISGTFDVLTDLTIFIALAFNGLSVAAVYVLRRKLPEASRPYRVWGYPVVPALFLAATLYLMINMLVATPGRTFAGTICVLVGLPVYFHYSRKLPPSKVSDWFVSGTDDDG